MTPHELNFALLIMLRDTVDAGKLLDNDYGSQFARRIFIKSSFSNLEGVMRLFKDFTLDVIVNEDIHTLSTGEYIMLTEKAFELRENGTLKSKEKFLRVESNFRFTFNILDKIYQVGLEMDKKMHLSFEDAVKVRNRITHPKSFQDLTISDDEIELCKEVSNWYLGIETTTMGGIFEWSKRKENNV